MKDKFFTLALMSIYFFKKWANGYDTLVLCALEIPRDVQKLVKKDQENLLLNREVGLEGLKRSLTT